MVTIGDRCLVPNFSLHETNQLAERPDLDTLQSFGEACRQERRRLPGDKKMIGKSKCVAAPNAGTRPNSQPLQVRQANSIALSASTPTSGPLKPTQQGTHCWFTQQQRGIVGRRLLIPGKLKEGRPLSEVTTYRTFQRLSRRGFGMSSSSALIDARAVAVKYQTH